MAAPSPARDAAGEPPPEWAANASGWPAHNRDLGNTRATTRTPIDARTVAGLKVAWRFAIQGTSSFGAFASTPIALGDTIYLQDLNSNVYALARATGRLRWRHAFDQPNVGPNGVSYGWGRLYGATPTDAFALDPKTGKLLWTRTLVRNEHEGIEIAPQLFDGTVLFSTVPSNVTGSYRPGTLGVVWALDAATGRVLWQHRLPSMAFGAATVANDVVFTSTYDGTIYAFATTTGRQLWKAKARAGINSFPAVVGRTLLIGAAAPGFFAHPRFELIAYALD